MTFGLENLSEARNATENATGLNVSQTTNKIFDSIASQTLGSTNLIGIFVLAAFAFVIWKANLGSDSAIVIMTPTIYFLGSYGWLPGGAGVLYGVVLAVSGLFLMVVTRYFFR